MRGVADRVMVGAQKCETLAQNLTFSQGFDGSASRQCIVLSGGLIIASGTIFVATGIIVTGIFPVAEVAWPLVDFGVLIVGGAMALAGAVYWE